MEGKGGGRNVLKLLCTDESQQAKQYYMKLYVPDLVFINALYTFCMYISTRQYRRNLTLEW